MEQNNKKCETSKLPLKTLIGPPKKLQGVINIRSNLAPAQPSTSSSNTTSKQRSVTKRKSVKLLASATTVTKRRSVKLPASTTTVTKRRSVRLAAPMTTRKLATKRIAPENAEDSASTSKKRKVGIYDYTGQINLLKESLKSTKEKLLSAQEKVDNYNIMEERLADNQRKFDTIERENVQLLNDLSTEKEQCKILRSRLAKLEPEYEALVIEHREAVKLAANNEENIKRLAEAQKKVALLTQEVHEHEALRKILHNQIQDLKGSIRVYCRVRPNIHNETDLCDIECKNNSIKIRQTLSDSTNKNSNSNQQFTFDHVFAPQSSQHEVFEELAQLIQSAIDGYNVCIFAYGQTGSGKTFTMQGGNTDATYGVIPRTIDYVYKCINKLRHMSWVYEVSSSFLEIYNENIKDLLDPTSKHSHEIKSCNDNNVANLTNKEVHNPHELKDLMLKAHQNRSVAVTDFNEHSSRSHAVTKILLRGQNTEKRITLNGSITLVDLAGSESAKTSRTDRLDETKSINKSLSMLSSAILALNKKDPHIPYRNSKLTHLLQPCLGGNSKTLMFINITPSKHFYNETINSLRFANCAKGVKVVSTKCMSYNKV